MPAKVVGMGGAEATMGEAAIGDGAVGAAGDAGMVVGVGGDGRAGGVEAVAVAGATEPMRVTEPQVG